MGILPGRVKVDILSNSFRGNIYGAAAGYGDAKVPIALTVDYLSSNSTGQVNAANVETRFASKAAHLAYFVTDRAAINVGYHKNSRRSTTEGYENKGNGSAISVQYKGIFSIPNMQYLNFETGMRRVKNDGSPNGRELSLTLDYYVNRSLGFGIGLQNVSGGEESEQGRRISLRASQFVGESLRLGVSFDKFIAKHAEDNFRDFSIMLDYRF